jgi:hypothetical protein
MPDILPFRGWRVELARMQFWQPSKVSLNKMSVAQLLSLRRLSRPRYLRRLYQVFEDSFFPFIVNAVTMLAKIKNF